MVSLTQDQETCACALSAKMAASWDPDTSEFTLSPSFIRGYHVYQDHWMPEIGEELNCVIEKNNPHDKYAVSVMKNGRIFWTRPQRTQPRL